MGFDPDALDSLRGEQLDNEDVAQMALSLVVELVGKRMGSMMHYTMFLPYQFCLRVHTSLDVRQRTLTWLQRVWTFLQGIEARAHHDQHSKTIVRELEFPHWTWVREICVYLLQEDVALAPLQVVKMVEDFIDGTYEVLFQMKKHEVSGFRRMRTISQLIFESLV